MNDEWLIFFHLRGCVIEAKDLMRLDVDRDFPKMGHGKIEFLSIGWFIHLGNPYEIDVFFFQKMGWFHVVPEISDCVLGGLGVFPAIDRFQLALGNIMRQQMDRAAMV